MVERSLADDAEIVFESNTYDEANRMRYGDFVRIENPLVGEFAFRA